MKSLKLTALLLTLVFSACGSDQTGTADETAQNPSVPAAAQPAGEGSTESAEDTALEVESASPALPDALSFTRPRFGDLPELVERRVIRVLTVYGPGRYYLDHGPKGFTAEYAKKLQETINERFDTGLLKVQVIVIPVARDQLFSALKAGRGDIIAAGTTVTDSRRDDVDFTIPVLRDVKEVLITGPSAPAIGSLEDLAGDVIYVRASSSYADSIAKLNDEFEAKGLEPIKVEPLSELLEDEDVIEMVNAGLLPWAVVDEHKTQLWSDVFQSLNVRSDLVFRSGGEIAWAIRKDSPELKRYLDDFLKDNRQGTLFGNIMLNRYLRDFDWASNALAVEELSRYRSLAGLFMRHGTDYGIDPALLAAQGYQESRLDQSVRSHVGAVGVMQMLPSTAADKNVNIPDIHEVEPNIEAGAKYLSFIRKRYFSGPDIDELNGALLALAAYNAGPSRVAKLRSKAEARGYDPNKWFDNVEVIAAEDIGRETVQYVSNILKYTLTYQMISRQESLHKAARDSMGI